MASRMHSVASAARPQALPRAALLAAATASRHLDRRPYNAELSVSDRNSEVCVELSTARRFCIIEITHGESGMRTGG